MNKKVTKCLLLNQWLVIWEGGRQKVMQKEDWRFCKKCLVRDFDEGELFRTMQEYIERIDEEIKTPQEEYERRLQICTDCESLMNGMCGVCGCYVEMRAAVHTHYCPAVRKKW